MVSPAATEPPRGYGKQGSGQKGGSHQGPLGLPAEKHVQTQVDVREQPLGHFRLGSGERIWAKCLSSLPVLMKGPHQSTGRGRDPVWNS